jgi:hypothetical protein
VPRPERAPRAQLKKTPPKLAAKEKPAPTLAAKPSPRQTERPQVTPREKPMGLAPADKPSISLTQGQPKKPDAGSYSSKIWWALARKKPNAGQRGSTTVIFAIGPGGALRTRQPIERQCAARCARSRDRAQRSALPATADSQGWGRRLHHPHRFPLETASRSELEPQGNILNALTIRER